VDDHEERDEHYLKRQHQRDQDDDENGIAPREVETGERVSGHGIEQQRDRRDAARENDRIEQQPRERNAAPDVDVVLERPRIGQEFWRILRDLGLGLERGEQHPDEGKDYDERYSREHDDRAPLEEQRLGVR
jgi:hypothetical protein